jgi:heterodisulfide reductase subunit B
MKRMILYPGCLVLSRFHEYEMASRRILKKLGIEVLDMEDFCCCGSSLVSGVRDDWINLPAYSLARAEGLGMDIITLCGSCTNTFLRANLLLETEPDLLERVNIRLEKLGLSYTGGTTVRHILEILIDGVDEIRESVVNPLNLKVGLSHPCQIMRPSEIVGKQNPLSFQAMREIVTALGAEVVDYPGEEDCCGSTILLSDTAMALEVGKRKLESAIEAGAEMVCICCGNCLLLLDRPQGQMVLKSGGKRMSLISLPHLIGLACGFPQDEMGVLYH